MIVKAFLRYNCEFVGFIEKIIDIPLGESNVADQINNPPEGQIILYSEGQTNLNVRLEGETVWPVVTK